MQRIVPMLAYEDGAAATEFLTRAFGFAEKTRVSDNGTITHAELELDGDVVMLATPTPEYQGPKRHRESCEAARRWSEVPYVIDGVLVLVDDLDAHFERARAHGAAILSEPEDAAPGFRHYRAEDPEGHRWMFGQNVTT